jgi:uridylate kinase
VKRVLLKLSGELLGGKAQIGIDVAFLRSLARELKQATSEGMQLAIVNGGGNFFRGVHGEGEGMSRVIADNMGMMATVINGLALLDALTSEGVDSRLMTAIPMQSIGEPFIRLRAIRHLEKGRVVILSAGTGNPYFSTDTAAALRAAEIEADAILKATKVDGVYDADPVTHPDAKRFDHVSYEEALERRLGVMDPTAFTLCMQRRIPITVFDAGTSGNIGRAVRGESLGTIID